MAIPIWKDTYYASATAGVFNILADGVTLFSGRAEKAPQASTVEIKVNRLCENYLGGELSFTTGVTDNSGSVKTFIFQGATTQSYTFIDDWSYETISDGYRSAPINSKLDSRQYFLGSAYNAGVVSVVGNTTLCNGTSGAEAISNALCHLDASSTVTFCGHTYKVGCYGDYVLYYKNLYGGYDSFVIEGNVSESSDFDAKTVSVNVSNTSIKPNLREYYRGIERSWEVYTGWLSDAESERLYKHLLTSNEVYLHNLVNDTVETVLISDTSAEKKCFKNGRKMVNYTINLKSAKERNRR